MAIEVWAASISLAAVGFLIWKGAVQTKLESRVYRIGWDPDPPFQALGADERATGLAIELVREAARRQGIKLEWVRMQGGADAALRDQKVDLWPLLTVIPERKSHVHITEPYLETEHCFLVRTDSGITQHPRLGAGADQLSRLAINRRNFSLALPGARLLATPGTGLILIPIPDIQSRMGVGSTFAAGAAAEAIREEIGKMATEGISFCVRHGGSF